MTDRYDLKCQSSEYPFKNRTRVHHRNNVPDGFNRFVDRRSRWGNPYKIEKRETRESVIVAYFSYLLASYDLRRAMPELRNCDGLVCHCHPKDCHADILAAALDAKVSVDISYATMRLAYSDHDFRWTCSFGTTFIRGYDLYSVVFVTLQKYHESGRGQK